MKTPSFISLILIILVQSACNRRSVDYSEISEFETVKEIQFVEHKVSVLLGMPMDMLIMNDMVIILDGQNDRFFYVLSIDDYSFLGSFISKGRGPGEEVEIDPFFKVQANDKILYQSSHDLKIAKIIRFEDSLDIVIHEKYDLPEPLNMGSDFLIIYNDIFNSNCILPSSKDYFVFNRVTGGVSEWGESTPLSDKKVHQHWVSSMDDKLTTVNLNDNRIASVFHLLPLLRIYSLGNEKLIKELQMSDASHNMGILLTDPKLNIGSKGLKNYYNRIKSTNDFIFALYGGFSISDYYKEQEVSHIFDWSRELHIWKWDGTLVMKLVFDRPVFAFDVTPDNKKIIATSVVDVDKIFEAVIPWD